MRWAAPYAELLAQTTPFVISHRANWGALDLAPHGLEIAPEHRYDPTRLRSRAVIDGLHRLDRFSFGPQEMLMPRWVLFDCGEFPGMVFGLGAHARDLPDRVRVAYAVEDQPDTFVPLSMWVAIPCAEPDAWFGHNLSSANLIMQSEPMQGLGTLTKALGIAVTRVKHQYGATQWRSRSLHVHLTFGEMSLLSAYTPAHTHPETFAYRLEIDPERQRACLSEGWSRPPPVADRVFDADDTAAIRALHADIEAGAHWRLSWAERQPAQAQRIMLRRQGLLA